MKDKAERRLRFKPLTRERWKDFVELFGEHGAYGGCWCMWWRIKRSDFERMQGAGNREAMKRIVYSGRIPGILAYNGRRPVGWCSVAPREDFGALERSRVLARIDGEPVWSIVCLYVAKDYRNSGLSAELINAAVAYVRKMGGSIVEAYPVVPRSDNVPPVSSFMGFPSMYEKAGFVECSRPSSSRAIMRCRIER